MEFISLCFGSYPKSAWELSPHFGAFVNTKQTLYDTMHFEGQPPYNTIHVGGQWEGPTPIISFIKKQVGGWPFGPLTLVSPLRCVVPGLVQSGSERWHILAQANISGVYHSSAWFLAWLRVVQTHLYKHNVWVHQHWRLAYIWCCGPEVRFFNCCLISFAGVSVFLSSYSYGGTAGGHGHTHGWARRRGANIGK